MRIAVVCPYAFDAHGGVQDQVARIVEWLRRDGHEAWAVAPGSGGPDGTRHVGRYRTVPANRSRAPISLDPRVGRRVATAVADADVVHIHEPFMPFVSLGAVLTDTPPKVGTFHADPGKVARAVYRGGAMGMRRLARRLGVVTAVSEVAAAAVRPFAEPRIVPNGIDLESYAARGVDQAAGRVLFIGRDDPRKGLDVLLAAWVSIRRTIPGSRLHIVGCDGSDDDAVAYLGRVSEERKAAELAEAEVLVAPNRGGESFGIVVLEGLASGCAVVASDLPAFRAVAGDAAVYTPVGDASAVADTVTALLGSRDRMSRLGDAGRARSRRFGRTAVMGGYLAAYEAALAST